MTPKEKAEELVGKYYFQVFNINQQKQCALIAVDEVLINVSLGEHDYWQNVKKEIELL